MLKLSKLEIFAVVAEHESFSAAAERLHLSQPAISRHISELEDALGIRLFKRMRRGVVLTTGGEVLRDYTTKILWMVREAEGALTDVTRLMVGQVRICSTPGVSVYLLPTWTRGFTTRHPNLTLSMQTDTTSGVIDCLLTGQADLGVVEGELDDLALERVQSHILQTIDLALVVGADHHWSHAEQISKNDLNNEPFVTRQMESQTRSWIDHTLNKHAIHPRIVAEFDNPEAIKEAVMSGLGVTILPTYAVTREEKAGLLRTIPILDLPLEREIKLLWDSARPFSPVTRAFLTFLCDTYPSVKAIVPPVIEGVFDEDDD